MDEMQKKRLLQGLDDTYKPQYDPIEALPQEEQMRVASLPRLQQNAAIEQGIANSDVFTRLKHILKSGYYGNKRTGN